MLTPDATMSDDGTDRDLRDWVQNEVFGSNGRMEVESVTDGGTALVANYTNDRWGAMRTAWRFTVAGDKISRFETGQACAAVPGPPSGGRHQLAAAASRPVVLIAA